MKKIITILLILMIGLVMVSGCDTNDSNSIPQPPSLPDDDNQQQDGSDAIPQPPTLPEE